MAYFSLVFSLIIGVGSLAWGFFDGGQLWIGLAVVSVGGFWGWSIWRSWGWFSPIGLAALIAAAAAGIWMDLPFGWMLAGGVGGLLVYDLAAFINRLEISALENDGQRLARAHLARLGLLTILIGVFSSFAMLWESEFSFEWAVLLGLMSVWGVSRLVRWMLRN